MAVPSAPTCIRWRLDARARPSGGSTRWQCGATAVFTARERAALAWTEAVTLLAESQVPDDVYAQARACFSEEELVDLTLAISTINSWNRLAVSFRQSPGG